MENTKKIHQQALIIRKCHQCGYLNESFHELEECSKCQVAYLPLKYMEKVHKERNLEHKLYALSSEIDEKDMIRGLYVLW